MTPTLTLEDARAAGYVVDYTRENALARYADRGAR